jgi:cytochrome bd-type quinol oxidase subunit 2
VDSQLVTPIPAVRERRSARTLALSSLGPLTVLAGVAWAFAQPYRVTLLHPRGEGFWWLVIEPPLLVVLAGLAFWLVVARPLVADLEERDAAAR